MIVIINFEKWRYFWKIFNGRILAPLVGYSQPVDETSEEKSNKRNSRTGQDDNQPQQGG